ncbi:hypothetical protein F5148DRAFT_1286162 [Russula earlei]|uniref:Uncharacterized protein n=1 Tax=Russula earlei TaxID=71964 RepID=A0ACC0U5A2_9AGAM|nr:hypothetical protein F5148DRAFT_1286162 [Russula earlei]
MSKVTFANISPDNLILIPPNGVQDPFPPGNIRTYIGPGPYQAKSGPEILLTLLLESGSLFTDISGIAGTSVIFVNRSGSSVTIFSPSGQDILRNGSSITYETGGTYTFTDDQGKKVFTFNIDKGTFSSLISAI